MVAFMDTFVLTADVLFVGLFLALLAFLAAFAVWLNR